MSKQLDDERMECVGRLNAVENNLGIETDPMQAFMRPLEQKSVEMI